MSQHNPQNDPCLGKTLQTVLVIVSFILVQGLTHRSQWLFNKLVFNYGFSSKTPLRIFPKTCLMMNRTEQVLKPEQVNPKRLQKHMKEITKTFFCDWLVLPGRVENEKMRQMEEKIQSLTKNLQDLQSTMNTMNEHFQQGVNKPGFSGGGPSSGGRNPADAAQPEIKETIHSIQTKLDQLDNRTQVSPISQSTCEYWGRCSSVNNL